MQKGIAKLWGPKTKKFAHHVARKTSYYIQKFHTTFMILIVLLLFLLPPNKSFYSGKLYRPTSVAGVETNQTVTTLICQQPGGSKRIREIINKSFPFLGSKSSKSRDLVMAQEKEIGNPEILVLESTLP